MKKHTIIIFLVGVWHFFEDGQDLIVGRSVLDGVSDSDGYRITWQRSCKAGETFFC